MSNGVRQNAIVAELLAESRAAAAGGECAAAAHLITAAVHTARACASPLIDDLAHEARLQMHALEKTPVGTSTERRSYLDLSALLRTADSLAT